MLNDMFKPRKCECCDGSGKSDVHFFHYEKDEVEIIKKTFPKFDPKKSCDDCFGKGEISPLLTDLTKRDVHARIQNKIWDRRSRRE